MKQLDYMVEMLEAGVYGETLRELRTWRFYAWKEANIVRLNYLESLIYDKRYDDAIDYIRHWQDYYGAYGRDDFLSNGNEMRFRHWQQKEKLQTRVVFL